MLNEELGTVAYDLETLHGTHYNVADFDTAVEEYLEATLAERNEQNISQSEKDNWRHNLRREIYQEWNGADSNQTVRWETANSLKYSGFASSGFVKENDGNPLLAPIHGISLKDYSAICAKISSEVDEAAIFKAMGIDQTIWEEVNTLWPKRMQEDGTYTVSTLFGQYFMEAGDHPKLQNLQSNISESGKDNLQKMKDDRYFYEELNGARQAAYEYGLDGAQWILENFGIGLGDFQTVAMEYMTDRNKNFNTNEILHFQDYQQKMQVKYADKFAEEQGGNVADDVEF